MNMNSPIREDDAQDKPLDPAMEEVRRKIVKFVGINLAFLFLALIAVAVALVYKYGRSGEPAGAAATSLALPAPGQTIQGAIPLPTGAAILSQSLSGDRVSLLVEEAGGQRAIHVYDLAAGRMVGRFAVEYRQ